MSHWERPKSSKPPGPNGQGSSPEADSKNQNSNTSTTRSFYGIFGPSWNRSHHNLRVVLVLVLLLLERNQRRRKEQRSTTSISSKTVVEDHLRWVCPGMGNQSHHRQHQTPVTATETTTAFHQYLHLRALLLYLYPCRQPRQLPSTRTT